MAQTLYAAKGGSSVTSDLYTVDPATAVATSVGPIGYAMTGLAFDPTDGTLYGVTSTNSTANPNSLITIDPLTGAGTLVGALGKIISDIAFDSAGQLYGWNNTNNRTRLINKATGGGTDLPSAPAFAGSAFGNGMSFNSGGVLYLAPKGATSDLFTVNPATGGQTSLGVMIQGTLPTSTGSIMAFSFDDTDVLYGIYNSAQLATLNTSTRVWSNIGTMSPGGAWDALAWSVTAGPGPPDPDPDDSGSDVASLGIWRFLVTSLASQTLTLLDHRATGRRAVFTLDAPAYHEGQVGSDDPEINLPWPDADSPALLAPSTRLIYGFQREPAVDPPWVCRFGGIVMSVEDQGADVPTTRYTAYDPWQLLMSRPIREVGSPYELPGEDGLTFSAGERASDIAAVLLATTDLVDGETHIDFSDDSLIHDTPPLGANITFDRGLSVGEAWQQLCASGTLDIVLQPLYEPITAPGKVVRFSTWEPPNSLTYSGGGTVRHNSVMGFDRAGKSLTGISRLVDGTRLANVIQFYANQIPVPVETDALSILEVGQYWAQQFFPGTDNEELVRLMAAAELALRRQGQRSIALDPGPERVLMALRDYGLRDWLPVWASRRLREPLAVDYDAFDPDNPSAAGYLRVYQLSVEIADDGSTQIRGVMTGKDVQ